MFVARYVRVTIHPAGMVTLMELADGEQIVAVGVSNAGPYVATAVDVTDEQAQGVRDAKPLQLPNRDN